MNRYLVAFLLAGGAAAAPLAASAHVDVVVGLPAIGIQFAPPVPVFAPPPVVYSAPIYAPGPVAVAPAPYPGYYPAWGRAYWGPHGYHGWHGHGYGYGHGWVEHGRGWR